MTHIIVSSSIVSELYDRHENKRGLYTFISLYAYNKYNLIFFFSDIDISPVKKFYVQAHRMLKNF